MDETLGKNNNNDAKKEMDRAYDEFCLHWKMATKHPPLLREVWQERFEDAKINPEKYDEVMRLKR